MAVVDRKGVAENAVQDRKCHSCGSSCSRRCQRCRRAYYCSTECQKKDWKRHRSTCNSCSVQVSSNNKKPATEAWNELMQLVGSSTPEDAKRSFYTAQDELQRLEKEKPKQKKIVKSSKKKVDQRKGKPISKTTINSPTVGRGSEENGKHQKPRSTSPYRGSLCYMIEKMPNLSVYQLLVYLEDNRKLDLQSLAVDVEKSNILRIQLSPEVQPVRIALGYHQNTAIAIMGQPTESQLVDKTRKCIYLRLVDDTGSRHRIDPVSMNNISTDILIKPHDARKLACMSCHQALLKDDATVGNVLLMPSSRWEDMADYLTCSEPGNTPVERLSMPSAGEAQRHTVLQDTTSFVIHAEDCEERAFCVLALPGYGQADGMIEKDDPENSSPSSSWRQNNMGATLTCSHCADIIGEAMSIDTHRVFHHKVGLQLGKKGEFQPIATLGTFVARELIQTAETNGVYSFAIVNQSNHTRILEVRLVSWETQTAYNGDSLVDDQGVHELQWKNVAKVLFQEVSSSEASTNLSLLWQSEWCCLPSENQKDDTETTVSAGMKLYLSNLEWVSLKDELTSSSRKQVQEIAQATVLAKIGKTDLNKVGVALLEI